MKNHIRNYIKIMGLAAVPFGTAQVHGGLTEYRIKVERKKDDKGERYTVGVECLSGDKYHREPEIIEIDWNKGGFPFRVSPRFANSVVQVDDMEKSNREVESPGKPRKSTFSHFEYYISL